MSLKIAFLVAFIASFIPVNRSSAITKRDPNATPVEIWALQAFSMLDALTCRQLYIFDEDLCDRIKISTHRTQMNLYLSNEGKLGNYTVAYPDNGFEQDPRHSMVLGIDPFPELSIPHVVFIFFLDKFSSNQCEQRSGQFYNKFCLYLAQKKQCGQDLNLYCQLRYLPLVYENGDHKKSQQFKCHEDVLVTATCPKPTELNKKEPLCVQQPDHPVCLKSRKTNLCQNDIICDYGFIISGGWNEINGRKQLETGALAMYKQLTKQGFHVDSLRLLVNNATSYRRAKNQEPEVVWGARDRAEMRSSIRKVCNREFCADTVVIYLSGVTADDGSLLLWDLNQDGVVNNNERYSPFHLLKDTANCKANRVILIVDSTNTESLITKMSQSKGKHDNMIVIGAGRFGQLPDDTFVKVFTEFSGMQFCLAEALTDVERHSEIDPFLMLPEGSTNVNVTLTGATCSRHSNLPTKTSGCMQLPSMMWKLFT
ncbi:uncharacterized protein LOC134846451 [Symsagittifera roscoffensis]|uniref:uncharacterized protein LOC134846451 n=1 Tax=Symsagittifera roscoffensis TaxID=84072 RepID=UPI00307B4326